MNHPLAGHNTEGGNHYLIKAGMMRCYSIGAKTPICAILCARNVEC